MAADTIAFIGGGNMARSLIGGLLRGGRDASTIRVAEPVAQAREALVREFGVEALADNAAAAADAGTVVLAVKPQVMETVCRSLADSAARSRPLLVSIAAGIRIAQIEQWLGAAHAVVRTMPNTPALLGAGAAGLCANARVDASQRRRAQHLLEAVGCAVWVEDEGLMDAVTAVSGSGPAYLFLLAEAMEAAAVDLGLPQAAARTLVTRTCLGAARMLEESGEAAATLRERVTSPGGTTQAALETLASGGFRELVGRAMRAAEQRGAELSGKT